MADGTVVIIIIIINIIIIIIFIITIIAIAVIVNALQLLYAPLYNVQALKN